MSLNEDPNLEMPKLSETFGKLWKKGREWLASIKWCTPNWPPIKLSAIFFFGFLIFIGLIFALGIFGAKSDEIPILANNTLQKIEQCIVQQKSNLMNDEDVLKNVCAEKYSVDVSDDDIKGNGGFKATTNHSVYFGATIVNNSNYIITEFSITVTYNGKKERWKLFNRWIKPQDKHTFTLTKLKNLPSLSSVSRNTVPSDSWKWSVKDVKGISVID